MTADVTVTETVREALLFLRDDPLCRAVALDDHEAKLLEAIEGGAQLVLFEPSENPIP
jgi:hypothetical protein